MIGSLLTTSDEKSIEKITKKISPQIIQMLEIILPYHIGQGRMKAKTPDPSSDLNELRSGVMSSFVRLTEKLTGGKLSDLDIEDNFYKAIKFAAEYNALSSESKKIAAPLPEQSAIARDVTQLLDIEYPKYIQLGKGKLSKGADIKIELLNLQQRVTSPIAMTINDRQKGSLTQETLLANVISTVLSAAEYEVLKEAPGS